MLVIVVKEGGLGNCKAGVVGNGGGVDVKYAERRMSETQLIKYVPGSTDKECVCGFLGVSSIFFRIFGAGMTRGLVCGWE